MSLGLVKNKPIAIFQQIFDINGKIDFDFSD